MITNLILTSLSTYGLAYILTHLDGPANILVKLRRIKLLQCFYCTAVWIAPIIAFLHAQDAIEAIALVLASIGAAYVLYDMADTL